jgi:predicted dehydrogenase
MDDKKIRVVMIGAGGFGKRHADFWHKDQRIEFTAVCGRTTDRTENRAKEYNIRPYTNIARMMEVEKPDLVDVVTHEKDQMNAIMQVLESPHARRVFTEKPLGTGIEQAWQMVKTARQKGIDLGVNFNRRFTVPYRLLEQWIGEGQIGEISYLALKFSHDPYDPPVEEDLYRWFFNVYPHAFDTLSHLGGRIKQLGSFFTKPKNHFYYKRFTVNFLFHSGAVGNLIGGGEGKWRHQSEYLEVGGTRGQAVAVNLTESAHLRLHDSELEQVWRPAIAEGPGLDFFAESVNNHLTVMVENLTEGKPFPVNATAALYAQILMQAARESHEKGGAPVDIENFINRLKIDDLCQFFQVSESKS